MKQKILLSVVFLIVVAALAGCKPASESNPSATTNATTESGSATAPGSATWNNTNVPPVPANPATTNIPAVTNQ